MKLDESMRARLRALAKSERTPELDHSARERAEHAALLARRERKDRGMFLYGLAMASAAALVFAAVYSLDTRGAESLARTRGTPVAPPVTQAVITEAPRAEQVGPWIEQWQARAQQRGRTHRAQQARVRDRRSGDARARLAQRQR